MKRCLNLNAPLLVPLLGMVTGILASGAGASVWWAIGAGILACLWFIALSIVGQDPIKGFRYNKLHFIWIFLAFCSAGILDADFSRPFKFDEETQKAAFIEGRVSQTSSKTSGDRAWVRVTAIIDSAGNALRPHNFTLLLRSGALECKIDDEVVFPASFSRIEDNLNWFSGGYAAAMGRKGIFYECSCESASVKVLGNRPTVMGYAASLRNDLEAWMEGTRLEKPTQNFLITILLGDRDYLDPGMRERFADAGISHMLALSGMHVAIIAGIVIWLLFPMNFLGLYKWRLLLAVTILFAYAFLTGLAPSTVRATLMMASALLALFLERKNSAWNSLLLATLVILAFSPPAVFDTGLQLSFLCVASLIFFVAPLNPIGQHDHPRLYKICSAVLTTLAAMFGTWVLVAWYFGTVPLAFLPANLVTLPLLPLYLTLAIIYFIMAMLGVEPAWLTAIVDWFPTALSAFLNWLCGESGSAIQFTPSAVTVVLWTTMTAIAVIALHGSGKPVKPGFVLPALGCAIVSITADAFTETPDEFIIQQNYRQIHILERSRNKEQVIEIPRGTLTECRVAGQRIGVLDCDLPESDSLHCDGNYDVLILGSGFTDSIGRAEAMLSPARIVLHSSIVSAREESLLRQAQERGTPCHSLRIDGPYRSGTAAKKTDKL